MLSGGRDQYRVLNAAGVVRLTTPSVGIAFTVAIRLAADDRFVWITSSYGLVQAASTWDQWAAPPRGDRGEHVLAGVVAGARSLGGDVAERVAALA